MRTDDGVGAAELTIPSRTLLGSVRNAARVLRSFTHADQELGVSEIARRLGLSTSTTHRLVATLEAERLLEQNRRTGRYRLSLALFELGSTVAAHVDLHEAAVSAIHALRHSVGEMVHVGVLDGVEVVYLERLESPHLLPLFRQIGHRQPAHATSAGKVMLAALDQPELERRLAGVQLTALTPHTINDVGALRDELALVRRRGWALNIEEGRLGLSSVGAPVRLPEGSVIAAVTIVGSSERLNPQDLHRYRAAVVETAAVIGRRLGRRRGGAFRA